MDEKPGDPLDYADPYMPTPVMNDSEWLRDLLVAGVIIFVIALAIVFLIFQLLGQLGVMR